MIAYGMVCNYIHSLLGVGKQGRWYSYAHMVCVRTDKYFSKVRITLQKKLGVVGNVVCCQHLPHA